MTIRNCFRLLGWIALIHLLTSLLGIGLLGLLFDPLGGRSDTSLLCLCMMLPWVLWGWITPQKARSGWKGILSVLVVWVILSGASYLLGEGYVIVPVIPQYLTGIGLAGLWPGNPYSSWYLDTFGPAMMMLSHFLLPAMFGLGMLLPPPQKNK